MKNIKTLLGSSIVALVLATPAWASPKTVTLNVSGMTCAACPITVKKALEKVPGVSSVDVRFEKKQVLVTFDDAKTNPDALVKATTNAGYPSQAEKVTKQGICGQHGITTGDEARRHVCLTVVPKSRTLKPRQRRCLCR